MSSLFSVRSRAVGNEDAPGMPCRRFLVRLGAAATVPVLDACGADLPGSGGSFASAKPEASGAPRTRVTQTQSPGRDVHNTSFPITALVISWTGPHRGVRLRLYDKDGAPGNWHSVSPGCPCGKNPSAPETTQTPVASHTLVPAHGSFGYQLDATSDVHVVNAIAIDSGLLPALQGEDAIGSPSATPSSSPTATGAPVPVFPPVGLITRAQWGAAESKRFKADGTENSPTRFFPAQALTVHHTDTANTDPDPAATVRAIYEQRAISIDWGDIGYHFLIDQQGRIYEGRFSGDDGVPTHDKQNRVVTGFHTIGFNSGNIGIALLGDFNKNQQSLPMRNALVRLLASLAKLHGLDVQSDITYRNPLDGRTKQAPALAGHRGRVSTEFPGTATYMDLETVRGQAAGLLTA
ncbi:peptidoglycan recognition protein family protein [Streptomyces flaveolus]|uniref:peptidoglycan recognition protein family protein n=1 Tax=Streptomyces flaveolus TaxID=67297 RepID=UPI00340DC408